MPHQKVSRIKNNVDSLQQKCTIVSLSLDELHEDTIDTVSHHDKTRIEFSNF